METKELSAVLLSDLTSMLDDFVITSTPDVINYDIDSEEVSQKINQLTSVNSHIVIPYILPVPVIRKSDIDETSNEVTKVLGASDIQILMLSSIHLNTNSNNEYDYYGVIDYTMSRYSAVVDGIVNNLLRGVAVAVPKEGTVVDRDKVAGGLSDLGLNDIEDDETSDTTDTSKMS